MIPEDMQRAIDLILQSQAKSEAKMDRVHDEFEQQRKHVQGQIDSLVSACKDLVKVSRLLLARFSDELSSRSVGGAGGAVRTRRAPGRRPRHT